MALSRRTVGIRYNSLIEKNTQAPLMWNAFSTINSLGKGLLWRQSQNTESLVSASFLYSTKKSHVVRTMGAMYDSYGTPVLDIGSNFIGIIASPLNPFFDSVIEDPQNIVDTVEYRIGTNSFNNLKITDGNFDEALKSFQFTFFEFGTIPCQLRIILSTGEVFYSDTKYALIDLQSNTDVKIYTTVSPDKNHENINLGGINSSNTLGVTSKIISTDGLSVFDTEIQIEDSSCFPDSGYIVVGSEIVTYNNKTLEYPFLLKGCTRGVFGTLASTHKDGTVIGLMDTEGLFDNVTISEIETDDETVSKIDYRCVCVRNDSDLTSGDISLFFPVSPNNNLENMRFAVEKSVDGNTINSQELVNEKAEPSMNGVKEYLPTDFSANGHLDDVFDTSLDDSGDSSDSFDYSDKFGIVSSKNIYTDDKYLFLATDALSGEIRYRFNGSKLLTIDNLKYNVSVKLGTSVSVFYRTGKTLEEIKDKEFKLSETYNEYIETKDEITVEEFVQFLDIKITMKRGNLNNSSPSFGDYLIQYWESGYSSSVRNSDELKQRNIITSCKAKCYYQKDGLCKSKKQLVFCSQHRS